ncbi:MAG: tRNA (N(6)-L-threonylcarbamoyladenosine(37)-C(2))-methylthiotransferase MtaB [Lachnospiraceae bacterium]|nr:tRNA (N(6)-L-threonylcarbamoyladenosine(37)-C(2))-methylthiotransferase MtaB [Lachnospiraceae bacterium]
MKKAALHNLGCKVNAYETEAMRELLEEDGYEIVPFSEKADVYVVNTCTVTAVADQKSRQMLHRAKKMNEDAVVIAAGCYVQTAAEKIKEDNSIDILLGNNKKENLLPELHKYLKERKKETDIYDINDGVVSYESLRVKRSEEHTRAFLKVQDGCNQFCSYCLIPYARGRARSRTVSDVVEEVKNFAKNGYKEIVLTGIHLSAFGEGTDEGLIDLIEQTAAVDGIERVRLGSIEPRVITEDFAKRASKVKEMCPHFHLSLQSGCDETLKRMNRKYTAEEFKAGCDLLRKYFDNPALTTDVIVGFPGETEEEFMTSYKFYEDVKFYEMHVFKYSRRAGTRADRMPNQITNEEKSKRSHRVLELTKENSLEYRKNMLDKEIEVLFEREEEIDGKKYWTGFTKTYIRAAMEYDGDLTDVIGKAKVNSLLGDDVVVLDRTSFEKVK